MLKIETIQSGFYKHDSSAAVTGSYLKEALYSAGRKVLTDSLQEQRTCVWLGTWHEMLNSPGGPEKQESFTFKTKKREVYYFFYFLEDFL